MGSSAQKDSDPESPLKPH